MSELLVIFESSIWSFFQLSRVKVHSTTPAWGATNDLRGTRIRDGGRGEILLFKEIEWQTTRIEATADESLPQELLTPLRLIANQAKIRIVVKKRLNGRCCLHERHYDMLTGMLQDMHLITFCFVYKCKDMHINA